MTYPANLSKGIPEQCLQRIKKSQHLLRETQKLKLWKAIIADTLK